MTEQIAENAPSLASPVRGTLPLVSVIVVSWKTRGHLQRCLESIEAHEQATALEVIVVDNDSNDGTAEMLRSRFPAVRLVVNDHNVGFARACNQGMQLAMGGLLLLLNSDTYVVDDTISRLAAYLHARPEIGMASCQLQLPDGRAQRVAFRSLSIFRSLFEDLWLYKLVPRDRRADLLLGGYWDRAEEKEVDWLAGAFVMLRREVFEASRGFNESFFMYGEDSEWCMRLRKQGFKIFFVPLGPVYHVGAASSDLVWTERERLRLGHLGGVRAYANVNGPSAALAYCLARLFGASIRWLVYAVAAVSRRRYYRDQRRHYAMVAVFHLEAIWRWRRLTSAMAGPTLDHALE